MKKTFFIFFIIVFTFTGCSSSNTQISVNDIATAYLSQLNVQNSKIDTIKYDEISSYENTPPFRELTYITNNIDEVLEPFYSIATSENNIIENWDFVIVKLRLFNKEDALIFSDEAAKLLIGAALFDKSIENDLIGKRINKQYTFKASRVIKEFYNIPEVEKIIIEPQSIIQYKEGNDTKKFLNENGFLDLKEFYVHLFNMKVSEQDFENNTSIKDDFIKYSIDKCTFTISYDDLKTYSDKVLKEHMQSAESLGINIDEYYTNVLSLNEEEFFKMCADTAEKEIKKCLMIGALSQHFDINFSNDYFVEFCQKNEIDNSDDVIKTYANYLCLESMVLSEFVQLI